MKILLTNWFTESDNQTFDIVRALAALAILNAIILAGISVWKGTPLNMQDYGIGMGALFGGLGVALGMKKESNEAQ